MPVPATAWIPGGAPAHAARGVGARGGARRAAGGLGRLGGPPPLAMRHRNLLHRLQQANALQARLVLGNAPLALQLERGHLGCHGCLQSGWGRGLAVGRWAVWGRRGGDGQAAAAAGASRRLARPCGNEPITAEGRPTAIRQRTHRGAVGVGAEAGARCGWRPSLQSAWMASDGLMASSARRGRPCAGAQFELRAPGLRASLPRRAPCSRLACRSLNGFGIAVFTSRDELVQQVGLLLVTMDGMCSASTS